MNTYSCVCCSKLPWWNAAEEAGWRASKKLMREQVPPNPCLRFIALLVLTTSTMSIPRYTQIVFQPHVKMPHLHCRTAALCYAPCNHPPHTVVKTSPCIFEVLGLLLSHIRASNNPNSVTTKEKTPALRWNSRGLQTGRYMKLHLWREMRRGLLVMTTLFSEFCR